MFVLNKDVVESILSSETFSEDFKDLLMNYVDREISEREANEFLTVLSYAVLDNRRIRENMFDGMLSNERVNTLNTMLEGIRRSNKNNTLTNSDLDYIRNTLLRNFIIDRAPVLDRTVEDTTNREEAVEERREETAQNREQYGPNALIRENIRDVKSLREELDKIKEEVEANGLSIGINRLRTIVEELNSLNEINYDMQRQARFNNQIDDNELRDMLVSADQMWHDTAMLLDNASQIIDIKERLQSSKNEQITQEENHINEINNLLTQDRNQLTQLQNQLSRVNDNVAREAIQNAINQTQERITAEENLLSEKSISIDNLRAQIDVLNNGGNMDELNETVIVRREITRNDPDLGESRALMEEYESVLSRIDGRDITEIGLEELNSIRADLLASHQLSQDLQNRNRYNADVNIDELRNSLVRGEEIWNSVGARMASIDGEIELRNGLLEEYNRDIENNNEKIRIQEELIGETRRRIEELNDVISKTTDQNVLDSYQKTLDALNNSLKDQEELLNQLKELINETNKKIDIINKGGKIESRTEEETEEETIDETKTTVDSNLDPFAQLDEFRKRYEEILARMENRELDEMGTIELTQIKRDFTQLHKDNLDFIEKLRFNNDIDTAKYNELLNASTELYEDIRVSMIPPYEKLSEKLAIARELIKRKQAINIAIKSVQRLINERTRDLEALKKDYDKITDPEVRKVYEETIKAIEDEIKEYQNQIEEYNKELEEIERLIDVLRNGGPYKDKDLDNDEELDQDETKGKGKGRSRGNTDPEEKKKRKPKGTGKDDEPVILPPDIPRGKSRGLAPDVTKQPHVKYNKPKLTWKTALAVAAGVGIGATVFFTTGPAGVAVMSIVSGVANKFVNNARAKAAANRMNILGGEVPVEEVEEPKKGVKGAIDKFRKYIKSEEGLRDISWMLTSAIITGNALTIGSAIHSKMVASKAPTEAVPSEPVATEPTTTTPTVEPTPAPESVVATVEPVPTTPDSVYSGIRLGDNVGSYNVSVGHRQATKAFGGWDPLHLNQSLVNSDSVFSEFAIVDDSGKLIGRVGTPGLTLDEVCAQYGVNYSNVVLDVTKNGTPQAWISVEELINGVTIGGPTV